jgi:hypothetical protein
VVYGASSSGCRKFKGKGGEQGNRMATEKKKGDNDDVHEH